MFDGLTKFIQSAATFFGYYGSDDDYEKALQEWERESADPSNHIDDDDYYDHLDRY